jgi:CheY-like chemotaxis protein
MKTTAPENLVILVAEDDKGHFALVKKNLWRICVDAEIIHFPDGQKLMDFLNQKDTSEHELQKKKYLLLLDIKMPGMDGIEVLEAVKKDPELRKIPTVMLTTTNNPVEIDRCYGQGCSFYIVKPADYGDFMEAIEHLGAFLSMESLFIPTVDPMNLSNIQSS